jgi:hypothetical protein
LGRTDRAGRGRAPCPGDPKPAPAQAGDTSEISFRTSFGRRRELGEIGKANAYGLLLHAMIALDEESGQCLGLVDGRIYTRQGRQSLAHGKRALPDRESMRWLATARAAGDLLGETAASVTVIADRESDIYDEWASLPEPDLHLLTRAMKDRRLAGGGKLFATAAALRLPAAALSMSPPGEGVAAAWRIVAMDKKRWVNTWRGGPVGPCLRRDDNS